MTELCDSNQCMRWPIIKVLLAFYADTLQNVFVEYLGEGHAKIKFETRDDDTQHYFIPFSRYEKIFELPYKWTQVSATGYKMNLD